VQVIFTRKQLNSFLKRRKGLFLVRTGNGKLKTLPPSAVRKMLEKGELKAVYAYGGNTKELMEIAEEIGLKQEYVRQAEKKWKRWKNG